MIWERRGGKCRFKFKRESVSSLVGLRVGGWNCMDGMGWDGWDGI